MKHSENIGALAAALAKVQAEMHGVAPDSNNPAWRSKYASLGACWETVKGPLSRNGLAVIQGHELGGNGIMLTTKLVHSSGEWIEATMPLILAKQDMQGLGGATTYAKRYALCAIVGLAEYDDDGNAVSLHGKEITKAPSGQVQAPQSPRALPATGVGQVSPKPAPVVSAPRVTPVQQKLPIDKKPEPPKQSFQGGYAARKELHKVPGPPDDDFPPFGDSDIPKK